MGIQTISEAETLLKSSVLDPHPYIFGHPGSASGSVSHKCGFGWLQNKILIKKFLVKNYI
jgi:hypothetical protein